MKRPRFVRSAWPVLGLLAVLWVALVLAASAWLAGARIDLTRDRLYTLSPGTRAIIDQLEQPLELTLYFSDTASHGLPQLRAYHQRVVGMLADMARRAHGRIHFRQIDPAAYSEDEDRASAAGLTSVHAEGASEPIFFGLAGSNPAEQRMVAIPFFLPVKEPFLEYDLARVLRELSIVRKPRVAVFSGLPIWGGPGDAQGANPPWAVVQQLRPLFDVRRLDADALAALQAKDAEVLVLIQPSGFSAVDARAVDRYVQQGGRLLVFVDPDSEVAGGAASNLPLLFNAWGVSFNPDRVVLDRSRAMSVQAPATGVPVRHPAVLGLTGSELNRRDPITRMLSVIDVSSSGYFGLLPDARIRFEPLLQSSTDAMAVSADLLRAANDPAALYRGYEPDGNRYAIAVRLRGALAPAFAGNAPATPPAHPGQVILVADTDVLSDRLWVQPGPTTAQALLSPFANNGDFFANAADDLSGPSGLIAIRGRAVEPRRFTKVEDLRRQADERFKGRQLELEAELGVVEQRLADLQLDRQAQAANASDAAAVDAALQRKLQLRGQLRAVQRNLNADIERLSWRIKFVDILLLPILVTVLALGYAGWRARRRRGLGG